jgi:hypothetical protein
MPSTALIASCVVATSLVLAKLVGISAHLPPYAVPADIAALNKAHGLALIARERAEREFALRGGLVDQSAGLRGPTAALARAP